MILSIAFFVTTGASIGHQALAQTPVVTAVQNYVTARAGLAPGVRAWVIGSNFSSNATVEIGDQQSVVLGYADAELDGSEYLLIVAPMGLLPGEAPVVVRTSRGSSSPFVIMLDEYAPALFDGFFRSGRAVNCYGATGSDTARPGDVLTVRAVGLGRSVSGGDSSTLVRPAVTVGGRSAEIVQSVLSSQAGVYDVAFRVPPGDGYHETVLDVAGRNSNTLMLPVGNAVVPWGSPAVESIATVAGCGGFFATSTVMGDPRNPPASLGGTTLKIRDAGGSERAAPLLFVSPRQINYVVPEGTAVGTATVTITSAVGTFSTGRVDIRTLAPQLFMVGSQPAGVLVRVRNGVQTVEPLFETTPPGIVPRPIDMGPETDQLYLSLFGTGLRFA
ncbi:MAG TPA: hypothetical protein VFL57_17020, partial [Bryobacteraceae bacterium]|nr:hypothetical protein [Bryobacteraceae bacterium]